MRRTSLFVLLTALVSTLVAAPASAQLVVGPGQTYTTIGAAAAAATDGDTIEIQAGTYHEEVVWSANGLTIRGTGGDVIIDMTGMTLTRQGGKGIFIVDGADITIENITFVGASVPDGNGAGIRWQGGGMLTVRGCTFRNNEDGILGGNHGDNVALIENNEFVGNGLGDFGYTHSVYINEIDTLTFRGNWSHDLADGPDIGHLFKSRAHRNYVIANRLTAQASHSSYELQLPEGGIAYVIGSLIEQSAAGGNHNIVSIGGDGMQWPDHHVFLVNNTIVNDDTNGPFINATAPIDLEIVNNLFIGPGAVVSGGNVLRMVGNLQPPASVLVDAASFDYHLVDGSMPIDMGVDPGSDGAMSLVPMLQYLHPRSTSARTVVGSAIDVGAYEHGQPVVEVDAGTTPGSDAGTTPGTDGGTTPGTDGGAPQRDAGGAGTPASSAGCGCHVGARGPGLGALAFAVLALVGLARRRRAR